MRLINRNKILELIDTIIEAIDYADKDRKNLNVYVKDSREALIYVKNYLNNKKPSYECIKIENLLQEMLNYLNGSAEEDEKFLKKCKKSITDIKIDIKNKIKVKLKVLFLPYKASMWTSLESIWEEFIKDADCKVDVISIPYHELGNNGEEVRLCYEVDEYPSNVKMTHFWEYDIKEELPDIIFTHNPYDGYNNLTRVCSEYYSSNLKKYTNMLVYSSYCTIHLYNKKNPTVQLLTNLLKNYDKIIVQSDLVKEMYKIDGCNQNKIISLGSPKIDAIVNYKHNVEHIPFEWKNKINNKKVFLLNTTVTFFIRFGEQAFKDVMDIYQKVTSNNSILIWRSHPLERAFIASRSPELLSVYDNMINILAKSENVIIDSDADYRKIFYISDAMITTHSSLINEFMATGKPVFIFMKDTYTAGFAVDYSVINCIDDGGINMDEFISRVINSNDRLANQRIKAIHDAFINSEKGDSGKYIYECIKKELLKG